MNNEKKVISLLKSFLDKSDYTVTKQEIDIGGRVVISDLEAFRKNLTSDYVILNKKKVCHPTSESLSFGMLDGEKIAEDSINNFNRYVNRNVSKFYDISIEIVFRDNRHMFKINKTHSRVVVDHESFTINSYREKTNYFRKLFNKPPVVYGRRSRYYEEVELYHIIPYYSIEFGDMEFRIDKLLFEETLRTIEDHSEKSSLIDLDKKLNEYESKYLK